MEGKLGATLLLHNVPGTLADRVLLVGLGKEKEFREKEFRTAVATAVRTLNETGGFDGTLYLTELLVKKRDVTWRVRQAAMVALEALYRFDKLKSKKDDVRRPLRKLTFCVERRNELAMAEDALAQGQAIAAGATLMKDLANLPGNICTPGYLADQARDIASEHGMAVEVLEREDMEKLGMHTLLSVARGSHEPPKFIVLKHAGGKDGAKPIVLVGKGITFDTGGISIKPAANMEAMKADMTGAASVIAAMGAIAGLKPKLNVVAIAPCTENMPGGNATKPGDVVSAMNGRTIEVINTDAEGRLVLADGLCWAKELGAAAIVDVATLTGAVTTALGDVAYGLMTNNDAFCSRLEAGATAAGEKTWRLPMWKEYDEFIKSDVADCKNTGTRGAGTIVGAKFLEPFVGDTPWVHMDIAGVDIMSGDKGWISKGASGYSVRAMINLALAMG